MGWPAVVEGWLVNQGKSQTESYIRRGRPLATVSTDQLMQAWIKEFRVWTQKPTHRHQAMTDVEVELTIRGEAAPLDEVETEWENLRERSLAEWRARRREGFKSFTTIPIVPDELTCGTALK